MRPIFNIFFWIKWLWVPWTVHEQYRNSVWTVTFVSWTVNFVEKKKKKKKEEEEKNVPQDSAENAESKRSLSWQNP